MSIDPELVTVFDTQEESEALVVQSLLTSAGIEAIVTNLQAPQDVLPGVGGVAVRVSAAQAADARSIINDYQNAPEPEETELEETDDDSEPPA
jgi:hypothetical protein